MRFGALAVGDRVYHAEETGVFRYRYRPAVVTRKTKTGVWALTEGEEVPRRYTARLNEYGSRARLGVGLSRLVSVEQGEAWAKEAREGWERSLGSLKGEGLAPVKACVEALEVATSPEEVLRAALALRLAGENYAVKVRKALR
jgi:hypothetical protein